jgi:hypothetical protein
MKSSGVEVSDRGRDVRWLNEINYLTSKECLQKGLWIWGQLKRSQTDRDENKSGQEWNGRRRENDEYK